MMKFTTVCLVYIVMIISLTFAIEKYDKELVDRLEKSMLTSEHLINDLKDFEDLDQEEMSKVAENKKKYYFKLHDANKDDNLDGIEILQGLQHDPAFADRYTMEELDNIVKATISRYDENSDGLISNKEYFRQF